MLLEELKNNERENFRTMAEKVRDSLCMLGHLMAGKRLVKPALISGFCSMNRLGVFLLPPGWDTEGRP